MSNNDSTRRGAPRHPRRFQPMPELTTEQYDALKAEASQWPAETAPKALMMPSGYASGAGLPPMWGN